MAYLGCCGPSEVERMACDVGISRQDICTLAGKWPGSADSLLQRMKEIKLDPSPAEDFDPTVPAERRGLRFVRMHCSRCHAIDQVGESPLATAPPFRTLRLKYPVRPLANGVHPVMPRFQLEAGQVEDIMAYLRTLAP
jgi:cytochrome c